MDCIVRYCFAKLVFHVAGRARFGHGDTTRGIVAGVDTLREIRDVDHLQVPAGVVCVAGDEEVVPLRTGVDG